MCSCSMHIVNVWLGRCERQGQRASLCAAFRAGCCSAVLATSSSRTQAAVEEIVQLLVSLNFFLIDRHPETSLPYSKLLFVSWLLNFNQVKYLFLSDCLSWRQAN